MCQAARPHVASCSKCLFVYTTGRCTNAAEFASLETSHNLSLLIRREDPTTFTEDVDQIQITNLEIQDLKH